MTQKDLLNAYRCGYVSIRQLEDMAARAVIGGRLDDLEIVQSVIDEIREREAA